MTRSRRPAPPAALLILAALTLLISTSAPAGAAARTTARTAPRPAAPAAGHTAPFAAPASPGSAAVVPDWRMQSSRAAGDDGKRLSAPGYDDRSWYAVPARSTVMAGLVANRRYPDVTYSTNMRDHVDRKDFAVPWWYRRAFRAAPEPGTHTFLRLRGGVISRGEIWLNGTRLAGTDEVVGAYPARTYDVTSLLRKGGNALAVKAMPADPDKDLLIHFIDWAQLPPDRNQGMFRDVELATDGPVGLRGTRVHTSLALPSLATADVTVKTEVRNNAARPVTASLAGSIEGRTLRRDVTLAAHETRTVTFAPLRLNRPRVWWPWQLGGQPMYGLTLRASAGGAPSDQERLSFGVRDIRSKLTPQGHRRFEINGKPLLIRGGGWASDLFLRTDVRKIRDQLDYVKHLGLNTIRLEGKPENDELYDIADRLGILVLTGWECCSRWEAYDKWTPTDHRVARESARSEAERIRHHPSVLGFLIASDLAAPADAEKSYLDGLRAAEWDLPIVASAADRSSPRLGPSGMKMAGPYWWVPPAYWYNERLGGNFGFASEIGPGPAIPELDSMRKYMSGAELDDLWRDYGKAQYHLAPSETFDKLSFWGEALDKRYGKPASLADFVRKAQAVNYENNRAEFEAFGRDQSDRANPATGVIYWMLNDAWPTIYWHLFDHNLAPAGSYFGSKTALRPLHVQYSYDDRSIALVNGGPADVSGLSVRTTVFNLDGTVKHDSTARGLASTANGARRIGTLPSPDGLSTTYFVRLILTDAAGKVVSRNVYWLSTKKDELDYDNSTWYHTPQSAYADLTGLQKLPGATLTATSRTRPGGDGTNATDVTLTNTGRTVAFLARASVRKGRGGPEVLPARWTDNYVTLWPGETITVRATYRRADLGGAAPAVRISGWNVPEIER